MRKRLEAAFPHVVCSFAVEQTLHHGEGFRGGQVNRASRIPYFLLTDPRYIAHYRPLLDGNAGMSAADWARHFANTPHDAAFVMERRVDPLLSPAFPEAELFALSGYRSAVADRCHGREVVRQGAGWSDGPRRQDLADWHKDKLTRFDLRCRYMSALENTHQPEYVSEKIYDALAMGAVPLYVASPRHAVHRLLGSDGWINLHGQFDPVPAFDATQPIRPQFCDAYVRLQGKLARLFQDRDTIEAEYDRFCNALLKELAGLAGLAG